jgi:hypothetical protein
MALASSWAPSGYGADRHYSFDLDLNTQQLETLFAEEAATVALLAEVSVTSGAQIFSSTALRIIVANDVIRGDEGEPSAAIELKATQAEAQAGTSNEKWMTPLRTKEAIQALGGGAASPATVLASQISDSTSSGRTLITSSLTDARAHLNFFPSFANRAAFPATGDLNRVYTALDTFKTYVWVTALSTYVEISPPVKADWNATSGDAEILNKPSSIPPSAHNHDDLYFNAAVPWTANHTLVDGTRYLAGDVVHSGGRIYRAKFDNESLPVTDTVYWQDLGPGNRLNIDGRDIANIPKADWNATSGDAEILNKPTLTPFVEYVIACSNETTALTAGAAKVTFRAPVAFRLTSVSAAVTTASTSGTLIVDINNGANSALSTKLSIDATEKTSATAATPAVIDATYRDFSQDAEITIDIDQAVAPSSGAGLKVILRGTRL